MSKLSLWLPHTFSEKKKEDRISTVKSLLSRQRNDPFLKNIITSDEKWVFYDNVQHKEQWIDKDESQQPTPKAELHGRKIMLCVKWDHSGIINLEFLNHNLTQQQQYMHESALQWPIGETCFSIIQGQISKNHVGKLLNLVRSVLVYPPYSLDLVPSDFHLFLSLQNAQNEIFLKVKTLENFLSLKPAEFH